MFTKNDFSTKVENYVVEKRCGYIEAVVSCSANNNIEIETAAKLLTPIIRKKIEAEAGCVNLLKIKQSKLRYA